MSQMRLPKLTNHRKINSDQLPLINTIKTDKQFNDELLSEKFDEGQMMKRINTIVKDVHSDFTKNLNEERNKAIRATQQRQRLQKLMKAST